MADIIDMAMSGGCQCGAVRYHARHFLDTSHICHCRMCQKATGGFFAALIGVPRDALVWTRGMPGNFASSDHSSRGFCTECGTPLLYDYHASKHVCVTTGSLDNPAAFPPRIPHGPNLPDPQRLLNELPAARRCLLDPQRKAVYDAELRERLAGAAAPPPSESAVAARQTTPSGDLPAIAVAAQHGPQPAGNKTASRRPKPGRPPIWFLASSVAVTLVAIVFTAAVVMRSKPNRPATATAIAQQGSSQPGAASVQATAPTPTANQNSRRPISSSPFGCP